MNVTIKGKLIGGFTIILGLFISMLFFMINKFSESNVRLQNVADVYSKKINLSNELMIAVLDEASNEKDIILEKDIIQMGYYKDNIYKVLETIDKKTIELQELAEGKGIIFLNEFKTTWDGYKPQIDKIIALTMKAENDEALATSIKIGLQVRNAAIGQLQRIIDKNQKSMENAKIENSESYTAALNLIIALIFCKHLYCNYHFLLDYSEHYTTNFSDSKRSRKNCQP